jgi:hypothetical protein
MFITNLLNGNVATRIKSLFHPDGWFTAASAVVHKREIGGNYVTRHVLGLYHRGRQMPETCAGPGAVGGLLDRARFEAYRDHEWVAPGYERNAPSTADTITEDQIKELIAAAHKGAMKAARDRLV